MPFPQAPTGAWWLLGRWRRSGWLWCCARLCWRHSRHMTKRSSPAGSDLDRRGAWQTWLAWGSLSFQSRSSLSGACRTYTSSPPSHMHSKLCVRRLNLPNRLLGSFVNDCLDLFDEFLGLSLPSSVLPLHHLHHIRCIELCPQVLNCLDLHFEGAGNGPVVITWIGREHELYSGTSPISLVEHCVTFRYDRRLLSLLGFVHNWPIRRWSATKKKTGLH